MRLVEEVVGAELHQRRRVASLRGRHEGPDELETKQVAHISSRSFNADFNADF